MLKINSISGFIEIIISDFYQNQQGEQAFVTPGDLGSRFGEDCDQYRLDRLV